MLLLGAGTARAQAVESTLAGIVHDSHGATLRDVTLTAHNLATGGVWQVRSSETGRFAFLQLPLGGPYTLTAQRLGYQPEMHSGLALTLGATVVVDVLLRDTPALLRPVVVSGAAPDERDAGGGGNFRVSTSLAAAIPAINRNFTDLVSLAPTAGVQASLLGRRWTATTFRIDGAQSRNTLRAGEFGAGPFTLSLEALREFEVTNAAYDVARGRDGGGAVRASTRAGTNEWTASAFSFYRGSSLGAATDFRERSRGQREFSALQWGGSVGGPLVRDRAHLFVAVERSQSSEPLFAGSTAGPGDDIANGVANDSLTRLVNILRTVYALDTATAQLGRLERFPVANTMFARVDWRLTDVHHLTVTNNFTAWNSPLSGGVDLPIALREARSDYRTAESQATAALRSTFASGVQAELRLGISSSSRRLTPASAAPRGFVRIQSTLSDGTRGDTRVQFGGNRLAPDDSREEVTQFSAVVHVPRRDVLYSVGTDNTLTALTTYIAEGQAGLFEFNSLAELEARRAFRYSRTLPLQSLGPTTSQRVAELGAFAQAVWRPDARWRATVGLRWDGTAFLATPVRNALVEEVLGERTDRRPTDWTKLQPRAELEWDVDGTGRDVLRAGAGRFAAQVPYYLHHNQLLNDGFQIADITLTGSAVPQPDYPRYRADPATTPGLPAGGFAPPPYVNLVSAAFRTPSVWKGSASYRRRMFDGGVLVTGSLLLARTSSDYAYVDRNLRAVPAFTLGSEGGRSVFVPASTIDAQGRTLNQNALDSPRLGRVLELTSDGEGRQHAAIVEAALRLPASTTLDASYTFNRATDNTTFGCCLARTGPTFTPVASDPRDLGASWGPSDTDVRHKVALTAVTSLGWGVQVGARYVGSTGRHFSAVVNGDINGDESSSNDLAFVFDPDDPATPPAVAASLRKVLDNPANVAREYLRENVGRIAPRNGAAAPWGERIDVRVSKVVHTVRAQSVDVGLDIFNVANLLTSAWGADYQLPAGISSQNPVVQRIALLNVTGFDQATRSYRYTVNENFGVLQKAGAPYQAQLSLRYRF